MPRISQQTVQEVRDSVDLVELVRDRVALVRSGGRWWGPCPFHGETQPSFCLLPDGSRYYCFGCQETGDAVDWVREMEGVSDFAEAVETLAERFGVEVRYEESSPREEAERRAAQRRTELLDRAAGFYAEYLWRADEAEPARDYLRGRGFSEELIRDFRIGYAPSSGRALIDRAGAGGYTPAEMRDAGLVSDRGGPSDFFFSRITFPISDARGRVQGFGARTLDPNQRAKYVNSPEGPHFRKRTLLYGLDRARSQASRHGWVVVAEGYTDVLGMVASGIESAVACMGTALTTEQLRTLRRSASEVRVCFDGDQAGQKAAWRSAEAAEGVPIALSAVTLPDGADPGELGSSEEGRATLREAVENAQPLIISLVRARVARAGRSARERDEALAEVTDLLQKMPDSLERDEAVRVVTGELGLTRGLEERLRASLAEGGGSSGGVATATRPAARAGSARVGLERRVLTLAFAADPKVREVRLGALSPDVFDEPVHARIYALMISDVPVEQWPDEVVGVATALRAEAPESVEEMELQEALYRLQLSELDRRATQARSDGDEGALLEVLTLREELRNRLRGDE